MFSNVSRPDWGSAWPLGGSHTSLPSSVSHEDCLDQLPPRHSVLCMDPGRLTTSCISPSSPPTPLSLWSIERVCLLTVGCVS